MLAIWQKLPYAMTVRDNLKSLQLAQSAYESAEVMTLGEVTCR